MTSLPLLVSELVQWRATEAEVEATPCSLIPSREPGTGEQYRFHFDMSKCIGCKCCVVACNEQNGNPAAINWRRVGEVEGGHYPNTQRHYLSMGCNHCVEPSCLIGCPVEAYTKSPTTGVVVHSADACIGCQYCVWNCSYGVPQYNPERGVVGKCDLCHNRLSDGEAPACASACPEGAIAIEIVNVAEWKASYAAQQTPGLPAGEDCISTTRITLPAHLPPDLGRVDTQHLQAEAPHWPLVFMLVLTQLAVGSFSLLWVLDAAGGLVEASRAGALLLGIASVSLAASTLHLGRPVYAWRALRNLRRSWLSREVFALSLFAGIAAVYAGALWVDLPHRGWLGVMTAVAGAAGLLCSARLYMVPARPAWNSFYTPVEFFATAVLLGPLFVSALGGAELRTVAVVGAGLQLGVQAMRFLWLSQSEAFELRAVARLLGGRFQNLFLLRMAILIGAGIALPLVVTSPGGQAWALALALGGEILGRWLFFVSVVPQSMAAGFSTSRGAA